MDAKHRLLQAAETLFDQHGYMAVGMDRLTEAAEMSTRTLYKHAGSKAELMAAVLIERDRRFTNQTDVMSVDAFFTALKDWIELEGARGCLFLRAYSETGGETPEIADTVMAHKTAFTARLREIVAADLGRDDPALAEQVLVLFEGAIHAAVYRGPEAISAAQAAAAVLIDKAQS